MSNLDYCGIIILLRELVKAGKCNKGEADKIAARIAVETSADIIFPL